MFVSPGLPDHPRVEVVETSDVLLNFFAPFLKHLAWSILVGFKDRFGEPDRFFKAFLPLLVVLLGLPSNSNRHRFRFFVDLTKSFGKYSCGLGRTGGPLPERGLDFGLAGLFNRRGIFFVFSTLRRLGGVSVTVRRRAFAGSVPGEGIESSSRGPHGPEKIRRWGGLGIERRNRIGHQSIISTVAAGLG